MQHVKGVLIALGIAAVVVFLLSLLIPQQMVLIQETIVNEPQDSVYSFIKEKENLQTWVTDLNGLRLEEKLTANKNYEELTFTGHDKSHYRLEFYNSDRAKGLEIRYFKEDEKKAVFFITTKSQGAQTIVSLQQFWNLGINPFSKLIAFKSKKKSQEVLERDLTKLKKRIEN